MTEFRSATIPFDRLLPGIHGLRGIAAMAIMLYHLAKLADLAVPEHFSFIAGVFSYAVHLFFVLSAFSLMHSTEHTMHRPNWVAEYFVKRYFRIAPLYCAIMAGMITWPLIKSQTMAYDIPRILLNLTFTFGFAPWSSIVWGGWTVGVEMLFYAIFPILLLTVRSTKATLTLLLAAIIVTFAARISLHQHFSYTQATYGYNWAYFSFVANLCFFCMGMFAYRLFRQRAFAGSIKFDFLRFTTLLLLGILLLTDIDRPLNRLWRADQLLWGAAFMMLCIWQGARPSQWSANRLFEYLGERSYSIYLLHPIIIVLLKSPVQMIYAAAFPLLGEYAYFICAILLMLPLLAIAEVSYRLIELPGIRYAKTLNARLREQAESASQEKMNP
jgi:peptidoglycan/LPS O-acetylase OafA/YrhL